MSESKALVTIPFSDGVELIGMEAGGNFYAAITPFCRVMRLKEFTQRRLIEADPILSQHTLKGTLAAQGGGREGVFLRIDMVHGWLFRINPNRVKSPEAREWLLRFQAEAYQVLHAHFMRQAIERQRAPALGWQPTHRRVGGMWFPLAGYEPPKQSEYSRMVREHDERLFEAWDALPFRERLERLCRTSREMRSRYGDRWQLARPLE